MIVPELIMADIVTAPMRQQSVRLSARKFLRHFSSWFGADPGLDARRSIIPLRFTMDIEDAQHCSHSCLSHYRYVFLAPATHVLAEKLRWHGGWWDTVGYRQLSRADGIALTERPMPHWRG
jgi:hypothetical protein